MGLVKVEIGVSEDEYHLLNSTCFLRTIKTAIDILEYSDSGPGTHKTRDCIEELEDMKDVVEDLRRRVVNAYRDHLRGQ